MTNDCWFQLIVIVIIGGGDVVRVCVCTFDFGGLQLFIPFVSTVAVNFSRW